jgi:hypothetical protein
LPPARRINQRASSEADQTRQSAVRTLHCSHWSYPLLPKHDCATTIEPNDVERVLTDINANYGNRTLCCRSHWHTPCLGAPGQLIAGGAGARPDDPIGGRSRNTQTALLAGADEVVE